MSASNANKSDDHKGPNAADPTAEQPGAASTAPDSAAATPPAPDDVTTPPGGPKADDTAPGTVVGQLSYNPKMVDALLDERAGYVAAGKTERVKAVDKQLAAYGTTPAKATRERATRTEREATSNPVSDEKERQRSRMVDALLDEREGYVRMDKKERVSQVDEQLRQHGVTNPAKAARDRAAALDDRSAAPNAQRAGQQQTR